MPQRPFVLVGQQYLADSGRSVGDIHPVWTYAHVPHGYTGGTPHRYRPPRLQHPPGRLRPAQERIRMDM